MGKPGMKGSESPSYFLEHESGKYYTLIEGEGHPANSEYERGRTTGVRRREKTPTHGTLTEYDLLQLFVGMVSNPFRLIHSQRLPGKLCLLSDVLRFGGGGCNF